MSTASLNTIAIDVVGHYGRTAKNLLATYRAGTERAVDAVTARYEQLVDKQPLPWINDEIKANLVGTQQRVARLVAESAVRIAERAGGAVDNVSGRAVQGLRAFGQQTAWAHDLMVVNAIRKINLPVARLSLRIAGGIDDATKRLSQRVGGTRRAQAGKAAKSAVKRVRRAARTA